MSKHVAIVGATGAVGKDLLQLLDERNFPLASLRLFASSRSAGNVISFRGEGVPVEDVATADYSGIDLALFSAGGGRSLEYAPKFVQAGAVVVDNSSAFRMQDDVPLVIPEVNPQDVQKHAGIIANPNCSTIIGAMLLWPLHCALGIRRFTVATYQAASGAGQAAMDELLVQHKVLSENPEAECVHEIFPYPLAYNVIPQVDVFLDNGYSKEEMKFVHETRKIFHDDSLRISATCVRVPVLRAHSEAFHVELSKPFDIENVRLLLDNAPGVRVVDDVSLSKYPMPIDASGVDDVLVGRLRRDVSCEHGLACWVVGDQLRKGAALNAIQIAELL